MKEIIKAELKEYMWHFINEYTLPKSAFGEEDAEYLSNRILTQLIKKAVEKRRNANVL